MVKQRNFLNLGLINMVNHDMNTAEALIHKALQPFQVKKPAKSYICLKAYQICT